MKHSLFVSVLCFSATIAQGQTPVFGLKGYDLGAALESCPIESITQKSESDGSTSCAIPIDSLGGSDAQLLMVQIYNGKVTMVGATLKGGGLQSHSTLLDALRAKFGSAAESKPHLNRFEWRDSTASLVFDGYKGMVVAVDRAAAAEQRKRRATQGKADL